MFPFRVRAASFFATLFGFEESRSFAETRALLRDMRVVQPDPLDQGEELVSFKLPSGGTVQAGTFLTPSLGELRILADERLRSVSSRAENGAPLEIRVRHIVGDAGELHRNPAHEGCVFQAASQFNCLEMPHPDVTPEAGISGYAFDKTQGPACAIACAAGTAYRNYLVKQGGSEMGQPASQQLNLFEPVARILTEHLTQSRDKGVGKLAAANQEGKDCTKHLFPFCNGYVDAASATVLREATKLIMAPCNAATSTSGIREALKAALRVGIQRDTAVTSPSRAATSNNVSATTASPSSHTVTQVYCSAIPIAYSAFPDAELWEPIARVVLDATYEATLWSGVLQCIRRHELGLAQRPRIFLTMVGGGVFENDRRWIGSAIYTAVQSVRDRTKGVSVPWRDPLEVIVVHYQGVDPDFVRYVSRL